MNDRDKQVRDAIASFPGSFQLMAYPGLTFRLNRRSSYYSEQAGIQLMVQVERETGWIDFVRCSPMELRRELIVAEEW